MTPVIVDEASVTRLIRCHGDTKSYLWHHRFGHIGYGGPDAIAKKGHGAGISIASEYQREVCDRCLLGKVSS